MPGKRTYTRRQPLRRIWLGWFGLIFIVLLAAVIYAFNRPADVSVTPESPLPREISVEEAYQEYQAGTFFLDVREVDEWNDFHIPGATLIPLGELSGRLNELPKDQPIVVVCRSGNRSQSGRDILLNAGFENVASMAGGVSTWRSLGYPIEP